MAAPKLPQMPTGLPKGAMDYLKKNWRFAYAGGLGLAFLGLDLKNILDSDNKLKALLKTFKDFVLIRVAMVGVFKAVSDVMKTLVRDTGSLNEALKRLTQIQQYSRQFQSFTGSLGSAKQRVAELYQLSQRHPFKFEDIVEANKSLEVFTRGAYTSVEATKTIGEAALATGNSIGDTARAVGGFYDQLRSGKPVGEAAEQLRQMGLISGSTAEDLTKMSDTGAGVKTTFDELTRSLEKTAEGAAEYKNELEGVTAEHEKAVQALKVAFGAPWTQADVQTTKNMTDAWKNITPAIGKLSESFASLYTGASTFFSAFIKWVTGFKVVQEAIVGLGEAIKAVTIILGIFGVAAAIPLIGIILKLSDVIGTGFGNVLLQLTKNLVLASRAAQALQLTLAGIGIGSVVLLVAGFVATLAGAIIKAQEEAKQANKDFQDWSKSLRDSTAAILEQAAAVTTLTSKYEVLAKTIDKLSDLQKEQTALQKEHAGIVKDLKLLQEPGTSEAIKLPHPIEERKLEHQLQINEAKQRENKLNQDLIKQSLEEQAARQPLHEGLLKQEADRRFFLEQSSKGAKQRDEEARRGAQVAAKVEDERSQITARRMEKEKKLHDMQTEFAGRPKRTADDIKKFSEQELKSQNEINNLKKQEQQIGLAAPEFSAAYKTERAEQLRQAKVAVDTQAELNAKKNAPVEEKRLIEARLKMATELAGGPKAVEEYKAHPERFAEAQIQAEIARKKEAEPPSPAELREARVTELTTRAETKQQELQRRGNIAAAQGVQDMLSFTKSFESMRSSLGDQKAASVALAKTQEDIAQEYVPASHIVSSMQAVGGGGEVSQVDPQLDSARRREQLQARMVDLLGILAGQQPEQPSQPAFTK